MDQRSLIAAAVLVASLGPAVAQAKITIGKIIGGIGLHIPTYVAMDKGFFKEEGLDARFVELGGRPRCRELSATTNFVPIPSGGAKGRAWGAPRSSTWSTSR